jgi:hypothetical protein
MLTIQAVAKIKNRIETSFQPLDCRVWLHGGGEKLRFKVFDLDYDVAFESLELWLKDLTDDTRLFSVIEEAKSRVHARRTRLNVASWSS